VRERQRVAIGVMTRVPFERSEDPARLFQIVELGSNIWNKLDRAPASLRVSVDREAADQ
jgi:hypothetical protein